MDSHPVPQNVTSFEFHLIGDMTIKQFAYLATGLVTAYLLFIFLFPISQLAAIPLIALTSGLGVAFAFWPIGDRPLDHWVLAFFRAVYSPTKRLWQTGSASVELTSPQFQNRLNLYLGNVNQTLPSTPPLTPQKTTPTAKGLEISRLLSVSQQNSRPISLKPTTPAPQQPVSPTLNQNVSVLIQQVVQQNQQLKAQLAQLQQAPSPSIPHPAIITAPIPPLTPQPQAAVLPTASRPVSLNYSNTQIKIPPLTVSGPNIIAGTLTDPRGVAIDGVIVIITNQNNIPVRAVKTSRSGQFTGATPLPNGDYMLTSEKDGFVFDPLKVTLKGELLSPLSIQSKEVSHV